MKKSIDLQGEDPHVFGKVRDPETGEYYLIAENPIYGDEAHLIIQFEGRWYDTGFFDIIDDEFLTMLIEDIVSINSCE